MKMASKTDKWKGEQEEKIACHCNFVQVGLCNRYNLMAESQDKD